MGLSPKHNGKQITVSPGRGAESSVKKKSHGSRLRAVVLAADRCANTHLTPCIGTAGFGQGSVREASCLGVHLQGTKVPRTLGLSVWDSSTDLSNEKGTTLRLWNWGKGHKEQVHAHSKCKTGTLMPVLTWQRAVLHPNQPTPTDYLALGEFHLKQNNEMDLWLSCCAFFLPPPQLLLLPLEIKNKF